MITIIAEIGSVHDGSFGNAQKLIEAAAEAGADAVKFQTHIAEAETLTSAPAPSYFSAESRIDYFRRTGFSMEQWRKLAIHAKGCGVTFLSSPFSIEAVELLEQLELSAYKIPSGEVSNIPLLERIAQTGKPVLLSSGMSNWAELDRAVQTTRNFCPTTIMQCSSVYPCPPEQVGLNVMCEMAARYGLPVGYSDHTLGLAAPIAAVTLGAVIVEKHFTFSRQMYGSDAKHSMEPQEFKLMASAVREVATMHAHPLDKDDISAYADMKRIFEKSIVTARQVKAGTVLAREDLAYKKPGDGISAAKFRDIIGRRTVHDLGADHKLEEGDLQ